VTGRSVKRLPLLSIQSEDLYEKLLRLSPLCMRAHL
jgi:hypothetical protein